MSKAKPASDLQILDADPSEPRNVTIDNPLVINETEIKYGWVRIIDGDIIAKVSTKVTFEKLEKVTV
jgi:hypothetical protein